MRRNREIKIVEILQIVRSESYAKSLSLYCLVQDGYYHKKWAYYSGTGYRQKMAANDQQTNF